MRKHEDLWVTTDGSYGSGDIALFDTTSWTDEDFNALDEAADSDKQALAVEIANFRGYASADSPLVPYKGARNSRTMIFVGKE